MIQKTYYHRVPGARFGGLPNGMDLVFSSRDGSFTTSDPDAIRELDKVANNPASLIYTTQGNMVPLDERRLKDELRHSATDSFDGANKVPAGAQTVEIQQPKQAPPILTPASMPVPNADLQAKLEKARAEMAKSGSSPSKP